jgi:diguanylate cyclase (GGDEF)-like protein/PAS domain S-box-containing protein
MERLHTKLLRSHLSIAGLGFVVLCAALFATWTLGSNASRLATDIGPTAQASLRVLGGIQSSLAAMRGWVALGDHDFRAERKQAWEQDIFPAMSDLESRLQGAINTDESNQLQEISGLLKELEESQWWIEDVAQTPGNNRAQYYFATNIVPRAETILNAISGMIILNSYGIDDNRSKAVLSKMTGFRYHFTQSVTALERFLSAPESPYIDTFKDSFDKAVIQFSGITKYHSSLSVEQRELFQQIQIEITVFEQSGNKLMNIRNDPQWNVAQYRLSNEAVPLARKLLDKLGALSTRHTDAMRTQADAVEQVVSMSSFVAFVLLILMVIMTVSLSQRSARRLTKPISALSEAARKLANGRLEYDLDVEGHDELATLTKTFNSMRRSVQDKTDALEKARQELEERVARRTEQLSMSRDFAETTLNSIGDAVITTSAYETITMMNPVAERLTGWRFEEARGESLSKVFQVIHEDTQDPVECPVSRCMLTGEVILLESESNLICRDGSQIAIDDSAAPIHGKDGHVAGAILVFRDVTHERRLQRKLSYQATHDTLTGLVNRYEFEMRMENALMFARNEQRSHSVAFLDLDQFKVVNDTCGHAAGDELLRQLSRQLAEPIRAHDTLARLGGDEFAILLEDCDIDNAARVCEKIRQDIEDFRFGWDDHSFEVGVSIGLVGMDQHSSSVADVLSSADAACYSAKEAGRNRVHVSRTIDDETNGQRSEMRWVSRITEALDENRLVLFVQPIEPLVIDAEPESHCEVLVRMLDRDGSLILPGAFLPAAERYNLIQSIDRYVVAKVCEAYHSKFFGDFLPHQQTIAINLSGQSLGDKKTLQFIKSNLQAYKVPPEIICFEITETAAINNMGQALDFIRALKEIGCSFALDDFGSGLSSYGYLQNIPVDYIKIDGRFVKDIVDNPIDAAMVASINEIAHLMGKKTIAEFVENTEIADKLRDIGVDFVQGWGIGKPVPIEKCQAFTKKSDALTV